MSAPVPDAPTPAEQLAERRLARERAARRAAEELLERKSLELFEAMQEVKGVQRQLELALWASGEAIWEWQAETDVLRTRHYTAPEAEPRVEEFLLLDFLADIDPEDVDRVALAWRLHLAGNTMDLDVQFRRVSAARWFRCKGRVIERDPNGLGTRIVGTVKDITEQRQQDDALRILGQAFTNSRDALLLCDERWQMIEANQAFLVLAGVSGNVARGLRAASLIPAIENFLDAEGRAVDHFRIADATLASGGTTVPVDVSATRLAGSGQRDAQWILSIKDLRDAKRLERELDSLARLDRLTGLLNRASLQIALSGRIEEAIHRPLSILWINMDGFKAVNDRFEAKTADRLLVRFAERIASALPEGWTLGRWGGDEFLVIGAMSQDAQRALQVGRGILASIARPIEHGAVDLTLTASVGLAVYPEDGETAEALIQSAGTALRHAKRSGGARIESYHPRLDDNSLERLALLSLLRRACEQEAFHFVAQARVDAGRRIVGHEVLVRWQCPERGAVSPAQFIPLAEETGLIDHIGRLAIRAATQLAVGLREVGRDERVSVNLAARQLQDPLLVEILLSELTAGGADPSHIELEVTESGLLQDMEGTRRLLTQLRAEGFVLSLDDFGTGYSSLSYLQTLPFHKIKLDRSFLRDVLENPRAANLVEGVVNLCRALDLHIVAEGIETEPQFERLKALGITEFQGFLFHRPSPLLSTLD